MKQGLFTAFCLIFVAFIFTSLLSKVLFNSDEENAQVVILKDGKQIFSSNLSTDNLIWVVDDKVLVNDEIVDYFGFNQTVDELKDTKNLDWDAIYKKTGKDAEINMLIQEDSTIRMYDANCRDKIDVKTGIISHVNQVIMCVPHKLVIKITGQGATDA